MITQEKYLSVLPIIYKIQAPNTKYPMVGKTIKYTISILPQNIQDIIKQFNIKYELVNKNTIGKEGIIFDDTFSVLTVNKDSIIISFIMPPTTSNFIIKDIMHHYLHELGHLIFLFIISLTAYSPELKEAVYQFIKESTKGLSKYADKYIKEEYGKDQMRAGIHLKYHEQFAELFRMYYEGEELPENMKNFYEIFCSGVQLSNAEPSSIDN